MLIVSVETTPNPHSIKLNLDQNVGSTATFTSASQDAPAFVQKLLSIDGLLSVFLCGDFITLNKDPRSNWPPILDSATKVVNYGQAIANDAQAIDNDEQAARSSTRSLSAPDFQDQSQVLVQTFRGIPLQVKVVDVEGESRISLGDRFNTAAQLVQNESGADFLKERHWADHGVRYGKREDLATEVSEELQGIYTQSELERLVAKALGREQSDKLSVENIASLLKHPSWQERLRAVQEISQQQSGSQITLLKAALSDENAQVRRLAAAALGTTGSAAAIESLSFALLNDSSIGVRRTAGDALSDIGEASAQPSMCQALSDPNKLVRWRAARFLNDLGDEQCIPALETARDDSAYEVKLEVEAAIARILQGGKGSGPAWRRM